MPPASFPPSSQLPLHQHQQLPQTDDDDDDFEQEMNLANSALRNGRGGDKAGPTHPFRSLTPRRIAAIAAGLLFLIFFFGRSSGGGREGTPTKYYGAPESNDAVVKGKPAQDAVAVDKLPPSSPQKQHSASSGKCTPPPGQKATSYAIMIDAGSTGSRLHLYTFSHCDPDPAALPKLEHEDFLTTKPGLSSYAGRPTEAAESLRGMMQQAYEGDGWVEAAQGEPGERDLGRD
jgi:guanosine-diphosphatase